MIERHDRQPQTGNICITNQSILEGKKKEKKKRDIVTDTHITMCIRGFHCALKSNATWHRERKTYNTITIITV